MMALLERRLVRIPLTLTILALFFALAMVWTFPSERVKQILLVQADKALGYKYDLTISELELWWLTGVELHQVQVRERWSEAQLDRAARDAKNGAPPRMPLTVTVPRVAARLAPISSLLSLGAVVKFDVDFEEGGSVTGHYLHTSSKRSLRVDFNDLDMMRSGVLASLTGVPGFGELKGEVELELDGAKGAITGGQINLIGKKLTLGPGNLETDKIPSMINIEVPQTNFGNLLIKATIAPPKGDPKGAPKLTLDQVESIGRDIHMQVWGDVTLAPQTRASRSNVELRLKFDEKFINDNSLRPLLNVGQLRDGKGAEGWYGFSLYGTLSNVRFKGSTTAARGPSKPASEGPGEEPAPPSALRPAAIQPKRGLPTSLPQAQPPAPEPSSPAPADQDPPAPEPSAPPRELEPELPPARPFKAEPARSPEPEPEPEPEPAVEE